MKICPKCIQEVNGKGDYFSLGIDVPYINLIFHKECYLKIQDINKFLQQEEIRKGIYDILYSRSPLWT